MLQDLNSIKENNTNTSNIVNKNKFKTKLAIIVLYPAEHNYLTDGERIEDLIWFCDVNNLKFDNIYHLTKDDIRNTLQHHLKFSKILRYIKGKKPIHHPIVLLFEELNNLHHLQGIADKVDDMIASGMIEVYIAKGRYIFSKYLEHGNKLPSNVPGDYEES